MIRFKVLFLLGSTANCDTVSFFTEARTWWAMGSPMCRHSKPDKWETVATWFNPGPLKVKRNNQIGVTHDRASCHCLKCSKILYQGLPPYRKAGFYWLREIWCWPLVDISISILAILNNIEGQQLKDQLICEKGRCVIKNIWMLKCSR